MLRNPTNIDNDIVIPRRPEVPESEQALINSEKHLESVSSNMTDIRDALVGKKEEESIIENQIGMVQEEIQEEQKNIHPAIKILTTYFVNPIKSRYDKVRRKLVDKYHTIFVKGKFFEKVKDTFKKLISSLTGTWLTKLFGAILALAIFDPKGKILGKIIEYLVKAVTFILNAIANYTPMLIKNIINIITVVLPDAIKKILTGIFAALYNVFDIWMKEFPKESAMYKVLEFIRNIFSKDSPLLSFLQKIAEYFPFILAGIAIVKAYTVAMSILNTVMALNPVTLIIIGIIAALTALYIWRDKIAGWFESFFDWFKQLGIGFKILGGVIALLLLPITAGISLIYGLVKLFQAFSKYGVVKTFEMIWESIKGFFVFIWEQIKSLPKLLKNLFRDMFYSIKRKFSDSLRNLARAILTILNDPLSSLGKIVLTIFDKGFGWVNRKFGNFFYNLFMPIKQFFSEIIIWFKTISNVGLLNYLTKGAKYREQAEQLTRMVESVKETEKMMGYTPKAMAQISAAGMSQKQFDKFLKVMSEMKEQEVKVMVENIQKIEEKTRTRYDRGRSIIQPKIVPSIAR
jgi:hypothetical protein